MCIFQLLQGQNVLTSGSNSINSLLSNLFKSELYIQFKFTNIYINNQSMIKKGFLPLIRLLYECQPKSIKFYTISETPSLKFVLPYDFTLNSTINFFGTFMIESIKVQETFQNKFKDISRIDSPIISFPTNHQIISFIYMQSAVVIETTRQFILYEIKNNPQKKAQQFVEIVKITKQRELDNTIKIINKYKIIAKQNFYQFFILTKGTQLYYYKYDLINKTIERQQQQGVIDIDFFWGQFFKIRSTSAYVNQLLTGNGIAKDLKSSKDTKIINPIFVSERNQFESDVFFLFDFTNNMIWIVNRNRYNTESFEDHQLKNLKNIQKQAYIEISKNSFQPNNSNDLRYLIQIYTFAENKLKQKYIELILKKQKNNILLQNISKLFTPNGSFFSHFEEPAKRIFSGDPYVDLSSQVFQQVIQNACQQFIEQVLLAENVNNSGLQKFNIYSRKMLQGKKEKLRQILLKNNNKNEVNMIKKKLMNLKNFQNQMIIKIKFEYGNFKNYDKQSQEFNAILNNFTTTINRIKCIIEICKFIMIENMDLRKMLTCMQKMFKNAQSMTKQLKAIYKNRVKFQKNNFELNPLLKQLPCLKQLFVQLNKCNRQPTIQEFIKILFEIDNLFQIKYILYLLLIDESDQTKEKALQLNQQEMSFFNKIIFTSQPSQQNLVLANFMFRQILNYNLQLPEYFYIFMCKYGIYFDFNKYSLYILIQKIDWKKNVDLFILVHVFTLNVQLAYINICSALQPLGIDQNKILPNQKRNYLKRLFEICFENDVIDLLKTGINMTIQDKQFLKEEFNKRKDFEQIKIDDYI